MSVNMPHLHSLFASLLDGGEENPGPHTILLLSITGAVVASASSMPAQTRQKTVITVAAVAVETWNSTLDQQEQDTSRKKEGVENGEDRVVGGWATVEASHPQVCVSFILTLLQFGNVFVYPIPRAGKPEDPLFLMAVSGTEETGWDLIEERVSNPTH